MMVLKTLLAIYNGIRVQDFLDMAIIATLIYLALIWFKNTASRFVLGGISLLGVVYVLARIFKLYLTIMVLQAFFAILAIAMVVIFQEDIRRFLERLALWGSMERRTASGRKPTKSYADELLETIASLAEERTGALIVIKGKDPLERHLAGCTRLEGIFSRPLVASIFDKHSIGHDGAMIMEGRRVISFGCHLPLSQNADKGLGLRHTAALGLSERCDALCIVVSEETGKISLATQGMLEDIDNLGSLNSKINDFYEQLQPRHEHSTIPNWLKKNTLEKALAIFLSLMLWVAFGYQRDSVLRDFPVPIEYTNIPQEWTIENLRYKQVTVTIMGSPQAFKLFDPSTLKISIDLSKIKEGRQTILLTRQMVNIPSNLSLAGIRPDKISIIAHKLVPVKVPVQVKTSGRLKHGLALKRIYTEPGKVDLLVRKQKVKGIHSIDTEAIDLSGITESTVIDAKLTLPPDIRYENSNPPKVKVHIEIKNIKAKKKNE